LGIESISAYATVTGAVVAALALGVAAFQIRAGRFEARRATAFALYSEYMKLAMENPEFAAPSYADDVRSFESIKSNPRDYSSYESYVSRLLWAAEEILQLDPKSGWYTVLRDQLKYHALYLQEDWSASHYARQVQNLAEDAKAEYAKDMRSA